MLLPKNTIQGIEYYTVTERMGYGTEVYDVVTLFFRSWFKKNKIIEIKHKVVDLPDENGYFTHRRTKQADQLIEQLEAYVCSTYDEDDLDPLTNKPKAKVLKLVVNNDD